MNERDRPRDEGPGARREGAPAGSPGGPGGPGGPDGLDGPAAADRRAWREGRAPNATGPDAEPVFSAPWQAHAFALTLTLHERGLFTWPEWAAALADEIRRAQALGDPDRGDTYYQHWLAALERLVAEKGASDAAELERCRQAWDRAAARTPHGRPIELDPEDR